MYGLAIGINIRLLVLEVCQILGNGSNNTAHLLLLETIAVETGMGTIVDNTPSVGMGLCQFDKIGFDDVKERTSLRNKEKIYEHFGIDIDLVSFNDLRYNPLISVIFCRLKYILVPSAIPDTIQGRAFYWKRWYNSYAGKGSPEHYLKMNEVYEA